MRLNVLSEWEDLAFDTVKVEAEDYAGAEVAVKLVSGQQSNEKILDTSVLIYCLTLTRL